MRGGERLRWKEKKMFFREPSRDKARVGSKVITKEPLFLHSPFTTTCQDAQMPKKKQCKLDPGTLQGQYSTQCFLGLFVGLCRI